MANANYFHTIFPPTVIGLFSVASKSMVNVEAEVSKLGRIGEMICGSKVGAHYQPYYRVFFVHVSVSESGSISSHGIVHTGKLPSHIGAQNYSSS